MRTLLVTAALALMAGVAHAETATLYQPVSASRAHAGYSETRIDNHRVRVSFAGREGASLESVETNLLYRAAEVTLANGYDYFIVVGHNVENNSEYDSMGPPRMRSYSERNTYRAVSDIIMVRGAPPVATAYNAVAVQANLAAQIRRPD